MMGMLVKSDGQINFVINNTMHLYDDELVLVKCCETV